MSSAQMIKQDMSQQEISSPQTQESFQYVAVCNGKFMFVNLTYCRCRGTQVFPSLSE